MRYNLTIITFLLALSAAVYPASAQDTLTLSHKEFLSIVTRYHPLVFRYRLQNDIAKAEIQKSRGAFDPLLQGKDAAKTLDATRYYEESNIALDIPTWYGVALNGSYHTLEGERLDNSETFGGLYQFGITVPLARNLLYDKRRAVLEQAKNALMMTAAEQKILTNQLLLEAENVYWNWVKEYDNFLLQSKAVNINRERLKLVIKTYQYGERAAIDTTEALSQLQGFELQQQSAYLHFIKATQDLQLFLWRENQEMYPLTQAIIPSVKLTDTEAYTIFPLLLQEIDSKKTDRHNAIVYYLQKQRILESERRLKWQGFLPKVDFTYNFINKENYKAAYFPLFSNNYQYGIKLEIPLFLRQARSDYKIAQTKILQNQLDMRYKTQELLTKISTYKNEVVNYSNQLSIAQQNIANYERLLNAEVIRFNNGESSLFIINTRENKLVEAQEKIIELRTKFLQAYNQLKWMNENFSGN